MGWFDEQLKQRKRNDNDVFSDAFANIAGSVLGKNMSAVLNDNSVLTKNALSEIMRFYHIKEQELPENMKDMNEQMEYLLRPSGVMRRPVVLEKGWYKDAFGAMLGTRKDDGTIVALIPHGMRGYTFFDYKAGKHVRINAKNEDLIDKDAIGFYKSFPLRKISIVDLAKYVIECMTPSDYVAIILATIAVTLMGMVTPKVNNLLFSDVVASGSIRVLIAISILLICVSVSATMLGVVKSLLMGKINTKMSVNVEAATMMRILSLPADFFKQYGSGELLSYSQHISGLCNILVSTVLSTGLTSVFSLVYISQINTYAPTLVIPALCVIIATVLEIVGVTLFEMKINRKRMKHSAKESGLVYAMISGIQKIKLTGAEKRAFAKWGNLYAEGASLEYDPPKLLAVNDTIRMIISLVGTIVIYYMAIISHISVADFYAFNVAYGMVMGAFTSLAGIALQIATIKPVIEMAKPIMDAEPEIAEGKKVITRLSGGIELNNVSFRYNENMPYVLDDLSLKIRPGQYVAIVGSTGCGKSTLMRILLGFEKPQKGAVYYDGQDINTIDLKSLRQKIGSVLQNGKLFQGDIYSNIVISAPRLTLQDAWEAAELAGMAEDIRNMPMGMNTIIAEGGGGISGGQKQRLMIARAIAPKPKILMFDEATSALDNITQKHVSESLDRLKCTRIVIAHRLSTIRRCDRIIVLDKGKIIEDGTYEELIANNGFFAELVERQRIGME